MRERRNTKRRNIRRWRIEKWVGMRATYRVWTTEAGLMAASALQVNAVKVLPSAEAWQLWLARLISLLPANNVQASS
jgi:hypothetical protein